MITLQDFINKVQDKENNKVKITSITVEGFGDIEFQIMTILVTYIGYLIISKKGTH